MNPKDQNSYKPIDALDQIVNKQIDRLTVDVKKHLPSTLDPTSLLLKGHLLIEYYIGLLLILSGESQDFLEKSFFEKVQKCQNKQLLQNENIVSLFKLNKLRNRMAHELEYVISESDVDFIGMPFGKEYVIQKLEHADSEVRRKLLFWTINKNLIHILACTIGKLHKEKTLNDQLK